MNVETRESITLVSSKVKRLSMVVIPLRKFRQTIISGGVVVAKTADIKMSYATELDS